MLTDDLTFCPYRPAQEDEVVALLRAALGEGNPATPRTASYWRWKHFENPFGRSYILLATDPQDGTIAGVRTMMRWTFLTPEGEEVRAVRAVDTATHPRYQRRGIFSRLTLRALEELEREGVRFVFNTPNQMSMPGYLKMGWQQAESRKLYVRILNPWRFLQGVSGRLTGGSLGGPVEPPLTTWHQFAAEQPHALRRLIDQPGAHLGLKTPLSWEYASWRYGGHPSVNYSLLPLRESECLRGIAICRPNVRFGLRELVMADGLGSFQGLAAAIRPLKKHYDYIVCHFAPDHPLQKSLRRAGFVPIPNRKIEFVVRPLSGGAGDVPSLRWDLRLSDLELF
ncbi:MAG: GNAT family N-acetyltransferase [Armatimonadetes bacterium]|nr:GNAT family N-acetyltransferase [Armatimonadota bacterium]